MSQHFLLSSAAVTVSLSDIAEMTEEECYETFKRIRWAETNGEPVCPRCGCKETYSISTRRRFKYKSNTCYHQFSVTSGTAFASRKMKFKRMLQAILAYMNGAKGQAALHMRRNVRMSYKTAFVLTHKLREALGKEQINVGLLEGEVEVDAVFFGGYIKPANRKKDRRDRRLKKHQSGKRRAVVTMRERRPGGRSLSVEAASEAGAVEEVIKRVHPEATLYLDENKGWGPLEIAFKTERINHKQSYAEGKRSINLVESGNSRIRRAEIGIHHRISGRHLSAYGLEMAWREDNRGMDNGSQMLFAANAALQNGVSREWKGYWQRHKKD